MSDEVDEYVAAKEAIEHFWQANPSLHETYLVLAERFNAAKQALEMSVRANNASHADFRRCRTTTKYASAVIIATWGEKAVEKGWLVARTEYDVDRAKVEEAIANGEITAQEAETFKKQEVSWSVPKDIRP
jgi:hypothetical protein